MYICYVLARIQMVTKLTTLLIVSVISYVLAKIQMVTKLVLGSESRNVEYSKVAEPSNPTK